LLIATGDVGPNRQNPDEIFDGVRSVLAEGDLVFGQLEPCIAHTGTPAAQCRLPIALQTRERRRHTTSRVWCSSPLLPTTAWTLGSSSLFRDLELLHAQGIQTIGAGGDISEARKRQL
jgi:hypothetical protein